MNYETCSNCKGSGEVLIPSPYFSVGDRVKAVNMFDKAGRIVSPPLKGPVSYVHGGTFPGCVYVVRFDNGEIKLMGEGALASGT